MPPSREPPSAERSTPRRAVLVTGFPVYAARRLIRELVGEGDRVWMLVRDKFLPKAEDFLQRLRKRFPDAEVPEILAGDILDIDLGLTGAQMRTLHAECEEIHHIAAVQYLGSPTRKMRLVNVRGLQEVLEVALGMRRLERICHWSTAFVAGDRSGVVREEELDRGQRFRNEYERTKAHAERLARSAMAKLPISVIRPTIVVGESETGEVERFDGIYVGVRRLVTAPANVAVPLPGKGRYPLNVVPADFVARAARYIARHPDAVGGTYHLADPAPLTAKRFFYAVADAAGRPRPTIFLPEGVMKALLSLPGIRALARDDRTFVEWFDADVHFDTSHADAVLAASGIVCPPVPSYVDVLVRYVRDHAA